MVIDEFVTIIGFEMPGSAKTVLSGVSKTISGITDRIKGLGIVSAVTSGIFSAFSVNAAEEATKLANLSQSTGVAVKEIEALGAMYRQVGGDAKDFASDAETFRKNWGQELNLEKMVDLSRDFAGLSEKNAFMMGRSLGYSDSMIRTLKKGPDELRRMAEHAEKYNTTNKESLANLEALDKTWERLKSVIGPVANEVQGAFAPIMDGGLTWLAGLLEENKDSIRETMSVIGESVKSAITLVGGYLKDGWGTVKPVLSAYQDALGSVFKGISGLDVGNTFEIVKSGFKEIGDSVKGFYDAIAQAVNGGVLESMWESLKQIANSPVLKAIGEIAWKELIAAFDALKAVVGPVFQALDGILKVISGIVNLDLMKVLEGFQQIGYALGDAFQKVFREILPELGGELIKIITNLLSKLPVIGDYFKEDVLPKQLSEDEKKIKEKADSLYREKGGAFSSYTQAQADTDALSWFNLHYRIPRLQAEQAQISAGSAQNSGIPGDSRSNSLTNNTTNVTIYPLGNDPQMEMLAKIIGVSSFGVFNR